MDKHIKAHVDLEIKEIDIQAKGMRFNAYKEAKRRELKGYVKSTSPSSLWMVLEGETDQVNDYINWCRTYFHTSEDQVVTRRKNRLLQYDDFRIMD